MVLYDYFDQILDGIEFLIALGSIIGLLGLIVGIIFLIWGGPRMRGRMIGVLLFSFILLGVCGLNTGLIYFHIFR
jgi:hypothetical protein